MTEERWFEEIAGVAGVESEERAPARLKSKIYSAVVSRMAEDGRLLDLAATKRAAQLCVFENMLTVLPASSGVSTMNPCRVCHARLLGERLDHAPIFWPGCPYSEFHHG